MAESETDPLVGKVLNGRFEIIAPLGAGGMGRVYKAMQRPLDRVVALKVLNPRYDGSKDPGFEKRFFLEASMTAKLKHPNTITVHDYGRTDDGVYFIAMEYVEGETLAQALKAGPFPWPRALYVGAQVARSLREAHKLGLVHRDLKPANIMLLTEGTGGDVVKVLDFGLVKSFTPDRPKAPTDTELTQAGVLLGSPLYMAPEQARNEADPRTDIYALGVLIFQAIAGRPPFVGKESIDLIVKHIREKPPELRELAPDVPLEVNALVMKCLEKQPAARFQSMEELLDAMRAATSGQGMSGIFADPRSMSGQMPRVSSSGVQIVSPPPVEPSRPVPQSADERVTESDAIDPRARAARRRLLLLAGGLSLVGVAVGGVVALGVFSGGATDGPVPPPPKVEVPIDPPKPPPDAPKPPSAATVRFDVSSEPGGATVRHGDEVLGVTPFSFTREHAGDAALELELTFELDGYQPRAVVAKGRDGVVTVAESLTKKSAGKKPPKGPKKPPPDKPPGYKDDPYQ
ncbi:MAG: serine/threonine-protein kinase [Myxococcota bacterium]